MSSVDAAPYEALARSIEHELELIGDGRLAELDDLYAARAALMNKRVEIEILRRREALEIEIARSQVVGRTARGYAPAVQQLPYLQATAEPATTDRFSQVGSGAADQQTDPAQS